ncbi:Zinc finger protein 574 [Merluccius polli]|uniref:Zinc finger protein 574 n=1 Tax=Merluccius polli TaxID=89951 RepID=A0AA47MV20_MERPO|nr:Zinc finger protein 574 [Merluccius polli]
MNASNKSLGKKPPLDAEKRTFLTTPQTALVQPVCHCHTEAAPWSVAVCAWEGPAGVPLPCTTCSKRFRQLPHLQDHERIHSGLRPFCCWVCGKSFSVAARLTEHARTHSGEKPYACAHCPAAFRSRSNLDKHVRVHDGDLTHSNLAAADAAAVAQVLEGAEVLTSLAGTLEGEAGGGGVQTIYVLQEENGTTETVMISSDQLTAVDGSSQMVILPSSVLGGAQTIALPHHLAMDGGEIMVQTGASPSQQHTIEFIVEETVV